MKFIKTDPSSCPASGASASKSQFQLRRKYALLAIYGTGFQKNPYVVGPLRISTEKYDGS